MPPDTAIVTITRARNPEESVALLDSLHHLGQIGLPVFAADSGSMPQFLTAAWELRNLTILPSKPGLVTQVQTALRHACSLGHTPLIYTEPDKTQFFVSALPRFIETARTDTAVAVLIAARDETALDTFPAGQQASERALNLVAAQLLGPHPDLVYGPLALFPPAVAYALNAPSELGWGWRIYTIARSVLAGHNVRFYAGTFSCPDTQRSADETVYRLEQLAQNIAGLRLALKDEPKALQNGRIFG